MHGKSSWYYWVGIGRPDRANLAWSFVYLRLILPFKSLKPVQRLTEIFHAKHTLGTFEFPKVNALPYLGTTFPSAKTRSLRREGLFFFSFCLTILSTITYHPQHTKPPQQARTFPYRPSSRPGKEFGLPLLRVRGIANPTHDRPRYSNNGTIYWLGYVLIDPLSAREMAE